MTPARSTSGIFPLAANVSVAVIPRLVLLLGKGKSRTKRQGARELGQAGHRMSIASPQ